MMPLSSFLRVGALAFAASFAVACVVQSEPAHGRGPVNDVASGGPTGGAGGSSDNEPANTTPILVDVDTNQTMEAAPGQGVGVFTEYTAGGHWHVWWTCDSLVNKDSSCPFDVRISVASGAITNVKTEKFEDKDSIVTSAKSITAQTTATTDLDGLVFDTDPGAIITLDAAVAGQHDPRFLFFVQKGEINGGFKGTLTNPLMLEGSSP